LANEKYVDAMLKTWNLCSMKNLKGRYRKMKKVEKLSVLLVCLTALGLFFTSCGGGKSVLVGKWLLVEGRGFDDVELLKDGTGIVDKNEVKWKVEKNRIYVTNPMQAMSFDYQLVDSKLTLTDDDGNIFVYMKPGGPSALVGKWALKEGEEFFFESLEFIKDGKGNVDGESFKWAADKDKLFIIDFGGMEYKVSGSTLTCTFEGESIELKKQ
jgi:hypothetical protein